MNKILLAVIVAGALAQVTKLVIFLIKHHHLSWHDLLVTGGMPSSHSALVISLSTAIYFAEGVSTAFIVSVVLAFITLRDACGVRRSVGTEGKAIEKLFRLHKLRSHMHYAMGHTPLQVLVGSMIGLLVGVLVYVW